MSCRHLKKKEPRPYGRGNWRLRSPNNKTSLASMGPHVTRCFPSLSPGSDTKSIIKLKELFS